MTADRRVEQAIAAIDAKLSAQVAEIMHHPRFLKLEAAWRGLAYVAMLRATGERLKIRMIHVTREELAADLAENAFADSSMYRKVYDYEFSMIGGEPYGVLVGDYEFAHRPDDVALLGGLAKLAAHAFAPFIAAASPRLFGLDDFGRLGGVLDLDKIFAGPDYDDWRALRASAESRFVCLTVPRTRGRAPYGRGTVVEAFDFQETGPDGTMPHADVCWISTAYVMAARIADAFVESGWCTDIQGSAKGGRIEDLPGRASLAEDGEPAWPVTEAAINDRREFELARNGFLTLCALRRTSDAVFYGAPTLHKIAVSADVQTNADAAIASRLPFVMAASRFAHYVKVLSRIRLGSFCEPADLETWLNRWIGPYVDADTESSAETGARIPLRSARVRVESLLGTPSSCQAILALRPWLEPETLGRDVPIIVALPGGWG